MQGVYVCVCVCVCVCVYVCVCEGSDGITSVERLEVKETAVSWI